MNTKSGIVSNANLLDSQDFPLVLDLDHTLLRTDLLFESLVVYLKSNPLKLFVLLLWLLQNRAYFKRKLAQAVSLDVEFLPVNEELVAYAQSEHDKGRHIVLATAADVLAAQEVASRFAFIDRVISSDGRANLKGAAKAEVLHEVFPGGFVYAGDSRADLHVWRHAKRCILVETSKNVACAARATGQIEAEFPRKFRFNSFLKAARLHHWVKNTLVCVPLVLGGKLLDVEAWSAAGLAFFALGILASGTYLVNDLWDLDDDRRHWSKRSRPLASGNMTILEALLVVPVALAGSFFLASLVCTPVVAVLLTYLGLTLSYSFALKRQPVLDAFILALLFTLRLVLGIVAVGVLVSPWLLVFSMFLFASLSFAKRQAEVQRLAEKGLNIGQKIAGRGYFVIDAPFILAMGVTCGMASVLIMVLYLTQDALLAAFYGNSVWLWAMPPILFLWLSRIWLICQRGALHDDPVVFAMCDPTSLVLCGFMGISFVMAWVGVTL